MPGIGRPRLGSGFFAPYPPPPPSKSDRYLATPHRTTSSATPSEKSATHATRLSDGDKDCDRARRRKPHVVAKAMQASGNAYRAEFKATCSDDSVFGELSGLYGIRIGRSSRACTINIAGGRR